MASLSKIPSIDIFPKPPELFSLQQGLEGSLKMYKLSIYANDLSDDEHANFITNNFDAFKKLDFFFITKVLFMVVKKGHIKTLKVILQNGCIHINVQDEYLNTVLMRACVLGYFEIVNYLLEQGAARDIQNEDGDTALMLAAKSGRQKIVALLCKYNAEINAVDSKGNTALMLAANTGHRNIVLELIKYGADKDAQNKDGNRALMLAAKEGYQYIVLLLINKRANKDLQNSKRQTTLTQLSITKETLEVIDLLSRKMGIVITYDLENISSISTYANTLIKKLSKLPKEQSHTSNALVLFPLADRNGAFTIHQRMYIVKTLEKYYNVKIKHPTSAEQIKRFLEKREYKVLFISGHGSPENIIISEGFSLTRKNIQIFSSARPSQDAIVVLNSCSTGGKNGGIAKLIANITKMRTFAPEEDFNGFTMQLEENEFQIDFSYKSTKVLTRIIDPKVETRVESSQEEEKSSGINKRKRSSPYTDFFSLFSNF